jgi:nickel/cobalt transporter regulator
MKPAGIIGATLLVALSALSVATTPLPASAGPKFCPPGLAKKGCIPPGQRKKWARGDYIPHDVRYYRIHHDEYYLPRPREGEFYARIGGDIYLLAEATKRVIEAINLVDAATR